jgi:UDP-glucose 4-epimerase
MNVLVAGGAGYIGSHCVRHLLAAGHRPVVIDSLVFGHRAAVPPGVPFYGADLADEATVRTVLKQERIDGVMHFAAFAYVGESVTHPLKYYFNNVVASLHLLRAMMDAGVRRIVFSSTCATYGIPATVPIVESMPQAPINPYGRSKYDVEGALRALQGAHDLRFACFRYFNAAGASEDGDLGEDHSPETHLIPLAIGAVLGRNPPLQVFGTDYSTPDGTCLRDYVHVDDLCRAHLAALPRLEHPGTGLFYNLGTGRPTSVLEVLDAVGRLAGRPVPRVLGPRRAGDPPALYADATLARQELGWEPRYVGIEPIIATAWRWHTRHPHGFAR